MIAVLKLVEAGILRMKGNMQGFRLTLRMFQQDIDIASECTGKAHLEFADHDVTEGDAPDRKFCACCNHPISSTSLVSSQVSVAVPALAKCSRNSAMPCSKKTPVSSVTLPFV